MTLLFLITFLLLTQIVIPIVIYMLIRISNRSENDLHKKEKDAP